MLALFVIITGCIVFLERGERKIPVQYARRVVGQRVYGGQSTYIPFKINTPGVMPVIFASAVLNVPHFILQLLLLARFAIFSWLNEVFSYTSVTFYGVMIFSLLFSFHFSIQLWSLILKNWLIILKRAADLFLGFGLAKKLQNFLIIFLTRIGLVGAVYLALLAIAPNIIARTFGVGFFPLGGTSMLIMVGVGLETAAQIESYLIEHRYEGFLEFW